MTEKCSYNYDDSVRGWERHTRWLLRLLDIKYGDDKAQEVSEKCAQLAHAMVEDLGHNPETIIGLRKLLEARDCFVRSQIIT